LFCGEKKAPPKQAKKSRRPIKKGRAARTAPGSPRTAAEAVVLVIPAHVAADQEKAAMAHIVDFLQSQPPDVYRVVLNAIEPLWLEPKADAAVRQAIKQRFPGRFSDDEIGSLIHGAMFIMK
jgi:hypothetical protein